MTSTLKPDICIIGASPAALALAAAAAAFGVTVVVVTNGKEIDGRPNNDGLAARSLTASAKQAHAMRTADRFGIGSIEPEIDFKAVMRSVRDAADALGANHSLARFRALGVTVLEAGARFKDGRTVIADDTEIRARRFVLAVRSSPVVPSIPGLADIGHLNEETVFDLRSRPGHLVVIGGGATAIELGHAFRRLGSQVTMIDAGAALATHDPEMAAVVLRQVRADGAAVLEHTTVSRVERRGKTGVRVLVEEPAGRSHIDGTHLLIAVSRAVDIEGLDLDKAGIDVASSAIEVDTRLRTKNRHVYAIADMAGALQDPHVANYHAGLVLRAILFRSRIRQNFSSMPRAVFTQPELAHVGLTEADAATLHKSVRILRWPYAENDRAQAERKTQGHVKLVVDAKSRILGATIVGSEANELISIWVLAISKGLSLRDMASHVAPHPTMGEIGKRAAITYFAERARRPLVRRLIGALRLLG